MDLKNTINNTNKQKENLKIVANKIDNKLMELGGEQATDLSDVPNKMNGMISQYKKIAITNMNNPVTFATEPQWSTTDIYLYANFHPSEIIVIIGPNKDFHVCNSKENYSKETSIKMEKDNMYLEDLRNGYVRLHYQNLGSIHSAYIRKVIAIG